MSERQAKLKRKNQEETTNVKTAKKSDIITNLIIVIITVAVIALGAWAVYSKYHPTDAGTESTEASEAGEVQTVADVAEEKGLSTEDFISEYGLENVEDITGDTDFQTVLQSMTLENYAKYLDQDLNELIESVGVDAEITGDMTVGEVTDIIAQSQPEAAEDDVQQDAQTDEESE